VRLSKIIQNSRPTQLPQLYQRPGIQEEKQAIVEAGLASSLTVPLYGGLSPWQHMDDTGTRVDGENYHCQILCNPLYGAYFTTARKDRLTIIDVLRNGRQQIYRINEETLGLLALFGVSKRVAEQVRQLPFQQDWSEEDLQRRLTEQIPDLNQRPRGRIPEAAALAADRPDQGRQKMGDSDSRRAFAGCLSLQAGASRRAYSSGRIWLK